MEKARGSKTNTPITAKCLYHTVQTELTTLPKTIMKPTSECARKERYRYWFFEDVPEYRTFKNTSIIKVS
jgi:hypothetical protein